VAQDAATCPARAHQQDLADLAITERIIERHRANIFQTLEVDSMAEMVRLAVDLGIAPAQTAS
jgi:FixJ family two-component response regulator